MKPVIYLASDSTVQSYDSAHAPQTGWGQVLIEEFASDPVQIRAVHPQTTRFPHVIRYESDRIIVDNRAYAGRSARTFFEEGRLKDMEHLFKAGDYLFIQFAHNDANRGKPERYIPVDEYPTWLTIYCDAARRKGAIPVLVTAICMRTFQDDGSLPISFPFYRESMLKFGKRTGTPVLDLGLATKELCQKLGPEKTKDIFMWTIKGEYPGGAYCEGSEDNAHLKAHGARVFAGLLAQEIKKCPQLTALAGLLR